MQVRGDNYILIEMFLEGEGCFSKLSGQCPGCHKLLSARKEAYGTVMCVTNMSNKIINSDCWVQTMYSVLTHTTHLVLPLTCLVENDFVVKEKLRHTYL